MKALIVAAGKGERINSEGVPRPKPLYTWNGTYLIAHVMDNLRKAGVTEIIIVVGFKKEEMKQALGNGDPYGVRITYVDNDEFDKANGLSVSKAQHLLGEPFILSMSDHIFQPEAVSRFVSFVHGKQHSYLCTDRNIARQSDIGDATKVQEEEGRIIRIHKKLTAFNAIDCGLFYHTPAFFAALDQAQAQGDFSITGAVQILADRGKMHTFDIGDAPWMDIDTREELSLLRKEFPSHP